MRSPTLWFALVSLGALIGCVEERCTSNDDCPSAKICSSEGRCVFECTEAADCGVGFKCEAHHCVPVASSALECPADMVPVSDLFCLDRYAASRADATEDSPGTSAAAPRSVPGVLPWEVGDDNATAAKACDAAGKRLCTPFEWELACRGPVGTLYGYGGTYDPKVCNGLDTFGAAGVKLLPTGVLAGCTNGWGAFDLNGNLWEHVAEGDGSAVRGGAYNCLDSMSLHRCDYIPRTWTPSALGFRCCLSPEGAPDPGPDPDVRGTPDMISDAGPSDVGGCLDPDTGQAGDVEIIVVPPECLSDPDCQHLRIDGDPCHVAVCLPEGTCDLVFASDEQSCDDGNPCTAGDHCAGGSCESGDNLCDCQGDADCPQDDDLCNGELVCDTSDVPFICVVALETVVACDPPADPCKQSACQPATGICEESAGPDGVTCDDGDPCNGPDQCVGGLCQSGTLGLCGCPAEMVSIDEQFCMDRYEASRPDATSASAGVDSSVATSAAGVIPWYPVLRPEAALACAAAGKRLCTVQEVDLACGGSAGTTYQYGDVYSPTICNGIDAFCNCASPNCVGLAECPYPHCYNASPEGEYGAGCGAWFHVAPTGAFQSCVNEWGAYDVNGNVWELVDLGTEESWYTGGAFNCGNSAALHQCRMLFQSISAKGFRCCADIPEAPQ